MEGGKEEERDEKNCKEEKEKQEMHMLTEEMKRKREHNIEIMKLQMQKRWTGR